MSKASAAKRYTSVAAILHWTIAALILGQIAGGLFMHQLPNSSPIKFDLYQLHKSFGLSVLALALVRLAWRLTHKPPPLPASTPQWQKLVARTTHWLFYALMILTPLAGWSIVSVSPKEVPTHWFGLIPIPHLPFFGGETSRDLEHLMEERHEFLAFAILFLLALHVAAALKHQFFDKDGVMSSILPEKKRAWMGAGAIAAILAAGTAFYFAAAAPNTVSTNPTRAVHSHDADRDASGASSPSAPAQDHTAQWTVDYNASRLKFVGEEKGVRFEGAFSDFNADIAFDPENLAASYIEVTVSTGSAGSGSDLRDSSLPAKEWFDVKNHPQAIFASSAIRKAGAGYEADGVLTIKDFTTPVTLVFDLSIDDGDAVATGHADLIRTDFGLGEDPAWLNDEGVALTVRVEFEIHARQAD